MPSSVVPVKDSSPLSYMVAEDVLTWKPISGNFLSAYKTVRTWVFEFLFLHQAYVVASTYPVDRIPRCDTSPREARVGLGHLPSPVPLSPPLDMDIVELGQSTDTWSPAEVIDDEALHACCLGSIDHGDICVYARGANNTDDCILARHRLGKLIGRVRDLDDGDFVWERCGGSCSGDDGHLEARLDQGCRDGGAEVAGCLGFDVSEIYERKYWIDEDIRRL